MYPHVPLTVAERSMRVAPRNGDGEPACVCIQSQSSISWLLLDVK